MINEEEGGRYKPRVWSWDMSPVMSVVIRFGWPRSRRAKEWHHCFKYLYKNLVQLESMGVEG